MGAIKRQSVVRHVLELSTLEEGNHGEEETRGLYGLLHSLI